MVVGFWQVWRGLLGCCKLWFDSLSLVKMEVKVGSGIRISCEDRMLNVKPAVYARLGTPHEPVVNTVAWLVAFQGPTENPATLRCSTLIPIYGIYLLV